MFIYIYKQVHSYTIKKTIKSIIHFKKGFTGCKTFSTDMRLQLDLSVVFTLKGPGMQFCIDRTARFELAFKECYFIKFSVRA